MYLPVNMVVYSCMCACAIHLCACVYACGRVRGCIIAKESVCVCVRARERASVRLACACVSKCTFREIVCVHV